MIEEGDRTPRGGLGGKDSTTLACDLAAKRRWWPARRADGHPHRHRLLFLLQENLPRLSPRVLDIPYVSIDVPVIGRLKPDAR
jgi:hypothetical protein